MNSTLARYVETKRDELGMNQTELAERAGVPRTTVNRVETGTTKLPSADVRRRLAKALGVSHLQLLIEAGEITADEVEAVGVRGVEPADEQTEALCGLVRRLPRLGDRERRVLEQTLAIYVRHAPALDPGVAE